MHLVLALLLQSSPAPAPPTLPSKTELVAAYDAASTYIGEILTELPGRLGIKPYQPSLGFTIRTQDMGIGTDGLPQRHTFVVSVFRGTPAFNVGIRPGDRIAAVGTVECDTLTPKAVFFYMGEYALAIPLVLERDGKRISIYVYRAPLPCADKVWRQFPVKLWRTRLTRIRSRVNMVRDGLLTSSDELTKQQTLHVMSAYSEVVELIELQLSEMRKQLNPAMSPLCTRDK